MQTDARADVIPAALSPMQTAIYLGLHRATLYRLADRGELPRPIVLSPGRRAWLRVELDAWLAARAAARDGDRRRQEHAPPG